MAEAEKQALEVLDTDGKSYSGGVVVLLHAAGLLCTKAERALVEAVDEYNITQPFIPSISGDPKWNAMRAAAMAVRAEREPEKRWEVEHYESRSMVVSRVSNGCRVVDSEFYGPDTPDRREAAEARARELNRRTGGAEVHRAEDRTEREGRA